MSCVIPCGIGPLQSVLASSQDPTEVFIQYGALGAFVLILLVVTRALYSALEKRYGAQLQQFGEQLQQMTAWKDSEKQRGDQLQAALERINAVVRDQTVGALDESGRGLRDALAVVRDLQRNQDHDRERGRRDGR